MTVDISIENFKHIFEYEKFHLPIRWDGLDFSQTLESLFKTYTENIEKEMNSVYEPSHIKLNLNMEELKNLCNLLVQCTQHYLNGLPHDAYKTFEDAMVILMKCPLKIYPKSDWGYFEKSSGADYLDLFRIVSVSDNIPHNRTRIFHTPYNLRAKIATNRYGIAGYPSLYLGTNLDLCYEETHMNSYDKFAIASRFKLERNQGVSGIDIKVIELGIKPQDFINQHNDYTNSNRYISHDILSDNDVKSAYLLWYPLIAACSYIRVNKSDPFSSEYIIPQLLMQWIRSEIRTTKDNYCEQLIGIRYFSCASMKASEKGFNYVFPASGERSFPEFPFCPTLSRAIRLTKPVYLHEYTSISSCERELKNAEIHELDYVDK